VSGRGRRTLAPEEAALWQRVIASVTPLAPARPPRAPEKLPEPKPEPARVPAAAIPVMTPLPLKPSRPAKAPAVRLPTPTGEPDALGLDASWNRRLGRGLVSPESAIDLHGYTLASAYDRLDQGLEQAIRRGDRVLLLITGKPPRPESERPHARGAIRAAVGDWLAASRHADRIAAVRGAHPRHGGTGALYIVLRRPRATDPARKS
jgi:DNA-nicking Smr family endonuclease